MSSGDQTQVLTLVRESLYWRNSFIFNTSHKGNEKINFTPLSLPCKTLLSHDRESTNLGCLPQTHLYPGVECRLVMWQWKWTAPGSGG